MNKNIGLILGIAAFLALLLILIVPKALPTAVWDAAPVTVLMMLGICELDALMKYTAGFMEPVDSDTSLISIVLSFQSDRNRWLFSSPFSGIYDDSPRFAPLPIELMSRFRF